ncbi:response regulator transcription factor [Sphingobacterium wenxiniae]|uniref:DNA-binding response regulator, OmpR family, contains REC and winged-helix (WHTH) domain n=1 Tax=Sphingobacterium wenxiniae TaxID=683125 RepID=A0A1I6S0W3_9SPHI|nr:response regulator transcription factor [Sphingobacterium wenxiniae]SFS70574.1 DNA-binding response regulator, OmpR family, contains REC and winged-helix (wHTH) domain [Sphingobacterium wenxiniae]
MVRILYVEDELSLAMIVTDSLEEQGYKVTHKVNGREAIIAFNHHKPDIVVLDVMMPLMDGFAVAEEIRKTDSQVPILFLTALTQTEDVVHGFKLGANDYVRKPFKIEELIVRIEALVKRNVQPPAARTYQIGSYVLDTLKSTLTLHNMEEKLSFREGELLRRLYEQKDQVVPRDEIIRAYWNEDNYFTGRSLDVFISRIRKYLSKDERIKITNIRGVGYMLTIA